MCMYIYDKRLEKIEKNNHPQVGAEYRSDAKNRHEGCLIYFFKKLFCPKIKS
jgi:hypothetical protein